MTSQIPGLVSHQDRNILTFGYRHMDPSRDWGNVSHAVNTLRCRGPEWKWANITVLNEAHYLQAKLDHRKLFWCTGSRHELRGSILILSEKTPGVATCPRLGPGTRSGGLHPSQIYVVWESTWSSKLSVLLTAQWRLGLGQSDLSREDHPDIQ